MYCLIRPIGELGVVWRVFDTVLGLSYWQVRSDVSISLYFYLSDPSFSLLYLPNEEHMDSALILVRQSG